MYNQPFGISGRRAKASPHRVMHTRRCSLFRSLHEFGPPRTLHPSKQLHCVIRLAGRELMWKIYIAVTRKPLCLQGLDEMQKGCDQSSAKSDDLGKRSCIYMHGYIRCWCVGPHVRVANGGSSRDRFPLNPTRWACNHRLSLKDERNLGPAYQHPHCSQPVTAVLTLMQTLVILSSLGLQSCSWSVCGRCVFRQQVHILNR